ncbi:serine/threonine protein kinase, partial [Escherichia coli]
GAIAFGPSENRLEVPFYVSEYLPKTLRDAMSAGLLMVDKVAIAVQLLSLLCHLDELGIIHRDIKPENIFIRGR